MTDTLLPCPFCGGNDIQIDEMESFWDKNETSWRVLCIDCIAETAGDTKEQAIAAWNRRAGRDINVSTYNAAPVVRGEWVAFDPLNTERPYNWVCSSCGYGCVDYRTAYCHDCGAKMEATT